MPKYASTKVRLLLLPKSVIRSPYSTQQVSGTSLSIELSRAEVRGINLSCGCRTENNIVHSHSKAIIGGKDFTAGEPLISGRRCGSVVTAVKRRRSVYGLVKRFIRVVCGCVRVHDFAIVSWFPNPVYPDGDPLTVRIPMEGVDVNDIDVIDVVSLNDIQPSRVLVEIDSENDSMYMMRKDGVDVIPNI